MTKFQKHFFCFDPNITNGSLIGGHVTLDIGKERGLFIITSDGKMQLRILGSVRFSMLYDMIETLIKKPLIHIKQTWNKKANI